MRVIADLQIHSKYSRACSKDLVPGSIGQWADKKGIAVIGTGDFTHPGWLSLLKEQLEEARPGLYRLKDGSAKAYFMLTAEVSNIYKAGDKVRRVHNMVFAPNFTAVDRFIAGLEARGANLKADGRPIMGIHCPDLVKIAKEADQAMEIVPAHAWTPHFGVFGSLSGFDTVAEAFEDESKHIWAIETGLSSDPKMNWQVSWLDGYSLTSNSDAHSLRKIGREANVFEISEANLSYPEIIRTMKERKQDEFLYTIEFFPEEGKYHLDGHAVCKFSSEPKQFKKLGGRCPVCGKPLLRGVLARVEELADRDYGFAPPRAIPFKNVIPLEEVIAEAFGTGVSSKKVTAAYEAAVALRPEFDILLDASPGELAKLVPPVVAEAIARIRAGAVTLDAGYDGVFGTVHIFTPEERDRLLKKSEQAARV